MEVINQKEINQKEINQKEINQDVKENTEKTEKHVNAAKLVNI